MKASPVFFVASRSLFQPGNQCGIPTDLGRVEHCFAILAPGGRVGAGRHEALGATVQWVEETRQIVILVP